MGVSGFSVTINDIPLRFETHPSLFSPHAADRGTLAMLRAADAYLASIEQQRTVERLALSGCPLRLCDLGCGYGLVGVYLSARYPAAEVHMIDHDPAAVACARENVLLNQASNQVSNISVFESDAFDQVNETGYSLILSNPPYHTDFSVAKRFIEKGFNRLAPGGCLFMVTKRREWYKRKLISIFGGVKVTEDGGYFIFMAEKRRARYGKSPNE